MTRVLAGPSALQKGIPVKTRSSETSQAIIRRKSTVLVDRHIGGLRERELMSRSLVAVWIPFSRVFLSGFLWPIILTYLVHSSNLVYLRILLCVRMHLLAKIDFTKKGIWVKHLLTLLPFGLKRAFSVHVWSGSLLVSSTRNMWFGQGPASLP